MLEQPCFEIETRGIHVAMRTLEPHGQRPALARMHFRNLLEVFAFGALRVPAERNVRRNDGSLRHDSLDGKREARAALDRLRQLIDDADDAKIDAFPLRR